MYDKEFIYLHAEIQRELKKYINPSIGLLASLPNGKDYLKPVKMVAEHAIDGYLFTNVISDEKMKFVM